MEKDILSRYSNWWRDYCVIVAHHKYFYWKTCEIMTSPCWAEPNENLGIL